MFAFYLSFWPLFLSKSFWKLLETLISSEQKPLHKSVWKPETPNTCFQRPSFNLFAFSTWLLVPPKTLASSANYRQFVDFSAKLSGQLLKNIAIKRCESSVCFLNLCFIFLLIQIDSSKLKFGRLAFIVQRFIGINPRRNSNV